MKHLLLRRDERCNIPLMGCYKRLQSLSLYIIIALLLQQWTTATATLLWWISVEWSNKITNRVRFTAGVVSRIKNFILTPPPPPPPVRSCKSSRLGWGEARRSKSTTIFLVIFITVCEWAPFIYVHLSNEPLLLYAGAASTILYYLLLPFDTWDSCPHDILTRIHRMLPITKRHGALKPYVAFAF